MNISFYHLPVFQYFFESMPDHILQELLFFLQFGCRYFLSWCRKWNRSRAGQKRFAFAFSFPERGRSTPRFLDFRFTVVCANQLFSSWWKPQRCCFGHQRKKQLCTFTLLFNRSIHHQLILATFFVHIYFSRMKGCKNLVTASCITGLIHLTLKSVGISQQNWTHAPNNFPLTRLKITELLYESRYKWIPDNKSL